MSEANELLTEQEDTQHGRFLTFIVGEEVFGIEISFVKEIIGLQPVTALPEVPEHIKGIINLRGKIIPVVDVRLKFKKEPIAYTDRTCIIVLDAGDLTAGLIVDNVAEVLSIEDEDIVDPPDERTGVRNSFIKGIGKVGDQVKLLLDCSRLFSEEDIRKIGRD